MISVILVAGTKHLLDNKRDGLSSRERISISFSFRNAFRNILGRLSLKDNKLGDKSSTLFKTTSLILFLVWAFLSILWSFYKPIAIYRSLTLLEIILFAIILYKLINTRKWLKIAFFSLILSGIFQSVLGIAQFIHNGSLGLSMLGESQISPQIDGVAKIIINSEKHIRAYGTFPHPNVLAGFLVMPLFTVILETVERYRIRLNPQNLFASHETLLDKVVSNKILFFSLVIISIGLILTFSRSTFLGIFIATLFFIIKAIKDRKVKMPVKTVFLAITMIGITLCFLTFSTSFLSNQSIQERISQLNVSRETILKNPIKGVGIGQFIFDVYQNHKNLEGWQYQPAHNAYLLVFSELGVVGLTLFIIYVLMKLVGALKQATGMPKFGLYKPFFYILIAYLVIMLFDHYFWDIKTGIITFALNIAFLSLAARNISTAQNCKSTKKLRMQTIRQSRLYKPV